MKSFIYLSVLIISLAISLSACESQGTQNPKNKLAADLFKLAHMNGCIDCHRLAATVIGPSWKAIAERYKGTPREEARNLLIERVKKGSKGNWMTMKGAAGMPALENRVSPETIETLVDYILSLNNT